MLTAPPDYQALYENALLEAEQANQKAQALIEELKEKLALALFEINKMRRQLFGPSADNRTSQADNPNQITLFDLAASPEDLQAIEEQTQQAVATTQKTAKAVAKKREKNTRMDLPADLPRQEVVIHPAQDLTDYVQIGEEVTEILEITPPAFWVKRIRRTKWALKDPQSEAKGILLAPIPSRTVAKGLFGESLLAYLVIGKFADHLPLHRQINIFQRQGIRLAASTVSDNIASVCQQLQPLYHSLRREVLANRYLQADETPIRVQDQEKKGACHLGYYWAYHAPVSRLVLFDYQKGRGQEGPAQLLTGFQGVLQTDGYAVYGSLFDKSKTVTLAGCMAHVRRKFDEAVACDAPRAQYAVGEIAKLYAIEQHLRDNPDLEEPAICQRRLLEAGPILEALKNWMEQAYGQVLPSSPIGKALAYALKLWNRLTVYLYHGALQIDNNLIENTIRPIALGRKNYLFSGSHAAAQQAAMLYSFLGSCQRNQVQPHQWLSDVLAKLNDPEYEGKFSELLPNRWKP
jgi:transposase